jgi:hypothetical protein
MRSDYSYIASIIRSIALATPALALSQSGCIVATSSCDGFRSQRIETRVVVPPPDAAHPDAGLPRNPDECTMFCSQHGAGSGGDTACRVERSDGGGAVVVCSFNTMCEGRRPDGYQPPELDANAPLLGRYFAAMAAAEHASVSAFERMAVELDEHAFPALARRARRAAADEARHFRMTAALARKFGAKVVPGRTTPEPTRALVDMAIENAREGVVRETLGAIFGVWQSRRAGERAVRAAMNRIAADETAHAVLSWDVDRSARNRVSATERKLLDRARDEALSAMERSLSSPVPHELARRAGVPTGAVAQALVRAARERLYGQPLRGRPRSGARNRTI